jgi:hypothetical protein
VNFTTPLALLLLLTLPYFFWLGRPRRAPNGRYSTRNWREWVSLGLRIFIMLLLVLSLAGSQLVRAADELAVVFLVDASDSISPAQAETAETYIRTALETMTPNDQAAVILFGSNALGERPMSGLAELAPVSSVPQALQTDVAEAIRLGMALFPAGAPPGRRLDRPVVQPIPVRPTLPFAPRSAERGIRPCRIDPERGERRLHSSRQLRN